MIWVVVDTNVLLKGLLSNINPSRKVINLALAGKIVIAGSQSTMEEFHKKIVMEKFNDFYEKQKFSAEMLANTYSNIVTLVTISDEVRQLTVCRDPDDDEFIRVAIEKHAKIIITEDKDLLDLGRYDDIRILKPKRFIELYEKLTP
ncbi:MAG TPA: putative toxin-antitoxin system toxin component, PIN family [Candidatus Saccharibacteria bacterium]|mgnify:CR=1 FL=1|nr:putative toxin-antitoxin system toxin component, PIN family [Candidatus Saccharibacteria bacterium]HRQ07137.1 putative toxin-antitoxin system toxin component, PIN family [Candidatus Saccharibacteria bacterium]